MRIVKAVVLALPTMMLAVGGVGTALTINGVFSTPAYAAKSEKPISAKVGKPLKEALELAQAKKFKDAMAKAREAQAVSGITPYEQFKVNEIIAYIAVNLGDSATTLKIYETSLDSGELSPAEVKQRLDQLTKLSFQSKNYAKVIQFGSRYQKDVGPDVDIALLVAQAYYLQKDYPHAIDATQALIKTASAAGQPIKEDWLKVLMASQHEVGRDKESQATLEQLLLKYPNPSYWHNMFIYVQNEGGGDRKNMEVYRLKLYTGSLRNSEYLEMAQLALALGYPGDAKNVLEKGFSNKILGTGQDKARETKLLNMAQTSYANDQKNLPTLEKEAQASANGEADFKLGQTYLSFGDYDKAIAAFKSALKKGGVKATDEVHQQLGVAYLGVKKTSEAASEFKSVAADSKSKLAGISRAWAIYAQNGGK